MLWVLCFHVVFMVAWFAGLFYLPRLFVYHANSHDTLSIERFKVMEHKLFFYIMTPSGVITSILGLWLLFDNYEIYRVLNWMHVKLILALVLWAYHLYCGKVMLTFKRDQNQLSSKFFRFFNEVPTLLLIGIVIMAVVKPEL